MSILNNVIVSTEITHPSERNWELGDVITDFPNEKAHSFRGGMIVRSDTEYH